MTTPVPITVKAKDKRIRELERLLKQEEDRTDTLLSLLVSEHRMLKETLKIWSETQQETDSD